MKHFKLYSCLTLALVLTACGDSKERVPWDAPGYVKGKAIHPTVKIGVPYKVMGKRYYPEYDPTYDEIGLASWYGPNFHGKSTANGERYNQWAMTAAHKTLPMPSIVRVTHQETGKSIIVRINDRGPFADGRIIDLSRAAAEELGTVRAGVAKVRVEYLKEATEQYIAKLNLKKPSEWEELDMAFDAKSGRDVSFPTKVSTTTQAPKAMIKSAAAAPDLYQKGIQDKEVSTLDVRGVKMEEIGYAEDPFTVLDDEEFEVQPKQEIPTHQDEELVKPHVATFRAEDNVSTQTPPAATPAPAPKATIQSVPLDAPKLYVQAGSFSQKDNAMNLAHKLSEISAVEVEKITSPQRILYRVLLGPTLNSETAKELKNRLSEYSVKDARIIRK